MDKANQEALLRFLERMKRLQKQNQPEKLESIRMKEEERAKLAEGLHLKKKKKGLENKI